MLRPRPLRNRPGVSVEAFGELARSAERHVVAAGHLVGLDAETLVGVAPRPGGREHPVVAESYRPATPPRGSFVVVVGGGGCIPRAPGGPVDLDRYALRVGSRVD